MHLFLKSQFNRVLLEARRSAGATPGTEICGLLVDTGGFLSFVQTRNASPRVGSFVLSRPEVRRIVAAVKVLGQEIVGTFHSHPGREPVPGASDIRHAVDDSLMFIFDCIGREGQLWKVKGGRPRRMAFGFVHAAQRTPNPAASGNGAITPSCRVGCQGPAVPEQHRCATL
jgi:proteasome lid subunit RPN8/RPN11